MSEMPEAVIVIAKCKTQNKTYGMRFEKSRVNKWRVNWAFPMKEAAAKREGYDKTTVSGDIEFTNEYPGCPYCKETNLTLCGCGHLSCTHLVGGIFTCVWCGAKGTIGEYEGTAISAGIDV